MYEVFFISYGESNAESNWKQLKSLVPSARRIQDIQGIYNAHRKAAEKSFTKMFFVVDGDAEVVKDFDFNFNVEDYEMVYIWHSKNPINDLEYGYGGIKLLPKKKLLSIDGNVVDMTTSLSDKISIIPTVSNITRFNVDEYSTWRSAFREAVKLSSKVIDRSYDEETDQRLETWCTIGLDRPHGEYCIAGACKGREFGLKNIGKKDQLKKINDFEWLRSQYEDWKNNG